MSESYVEIIAKKGLVTLYDAHGDVEHCFTPERARMLAESLIDAATEAEHAMPRVDRDRLVDRCQHCCKVTYGFHVCLAPRRSIAL